MNLHHHKAPKRSSIKSPRFWLNAAFCIVIGTGAAAQAPSSSLTSLADRIRGGQKNPFQEPPPKNLPPQLDEEKLEEALLKTGLANRLGYINQTGIGTGPSWTLSLTQGFGGTKIDQPGRRERELYENTALTLTFLTETRTEKLSLSFLGSLRGTQPFVTDAQREFNFHNLQFRGNYDRTAANSSLSLSLVERKDDIKYTIPASAFYNPITQNIELPSDLSLLTGFGQRLGTSLSGTLMLGTKNRTSFTLYGTLNRIDYFGQTTPDLVNNQDWTLKGEVTLNINDAIKSTLGLGRRRFTSEIFTEGRNSFSFDGNISQDLKRGSNIASINIVDLTTTPQTTVSFGHTLKDTQHSLEFNLGATFGTAINNTFIGRMNYSTSLKSGTVGVNLERSIGTSSLTDNLTVINLARVSYNTDITKNQSISLVAAAIQTIDSTINGDVIDGSVDLSYNYALDKNWGLSASFSHQIRKDTRDFRQNTSYLTSFALSLSREWSR